MPADGDYSTYSLYNFCSVLYIYAENRGEFQRFQSFKTYMYSQ